MREIKPNIGEDFFVPDKNILPELLVTRLYDLLSNFEYRPSEIMDISKHILDADIETALEDSVPLFAWLVLEGNNAKEKEEYLEDKLKILVMAKPEEGKKVSQLKAENKNTDEYKRTFSLYLKYKKIVRNCEGMKEAMKLRKEVAQTKSANIRKEGPYVTKE